MKEDDWSYVRKWILHYRGLTEKDFSLMVGYRFDGGKKIREKANGDKWFTRRDVFLRRVALLEVMWEKDRPHLIELVFRLHAALIDNDKSDGLAVPIHLYREFNKAVNTWRGGGGIEVI